MRRAAGFLVLLLCLYWTRAQGESGGVTGNDITQTEIQSEILGDQTNITPDIWAELKELRDMAIEHSVELRNSKSKMEKLEQENTAIQARLTASEYKNAVLEARMNASENEVEELKRQNTDMMARLKINEHGMEELKRENTVLEARMNASENEVVKLKIESADMMARLKISEHVMEELKRENTDLLHRVTSVEDKNKVLEARMNTSENEVEELKIESADMMARLKISENEVEELKRQNADQPKVAFSIGLTDSGLIGPFNTDITLKFSKVITNIGQAYSPSTGLFTAPVRGAYYFSFTTLDRRSSAYRNIYIYHNDKRMLLSYNYSANANESVSNSLVLQLEKGDVVYLVLPAGYSVYDDSGDITTFNGFLLFPL
ncbi:putative leucine-rich repeat-containing protein DDB_G0290503 isoform X9 [Scomber scombrus]|uniref:putative leucine-rich repeat-containing protein DDB_G0290503 isoform X9 n=1 Tax=Scomber scombrus TaxID=13677 RepID=UPI002DD7FA9A|nr:putative leucine-rich repeat-containing protein DDB_G0290503 isoform X9 [Scomber scombrus]